jgi:hypothetical protein
MMLLRKLILRMKHQNFQERKPGGEDSCIDFVGSTHLSLLDARIDGVQEVCSVLVTLGQVSDFFPQELSFVVTHHSFKGWVDIL